MSLSPNDQVLFSPTHRLQWEESQQKHVILYPEGMVELNGSSAEILKLCDQPRSIGEIATELEAKFATSGLLGDVTEFLETALDHGWISTVENN